MGIRCDGVLTQAPNTTARCSGTWVQEPDSLTDLYELLNSAFSTPEPGDVVLAFMAALTVPLIAYLVAWGYGKVISFAEDDRTDLN